MDKVLFRFYFYGIFLTVDQVSVQKGTLKHRKSYHSIFVSCNRDRLLFRECEEIFAFINYFNLYFILESFEGYASILN